jgi:hypothetical protein
LALSSLFLLVREKKNSLSPIDQGSSSLFSYPAGHGGASPSRSLTLLRLSAAVTSSRDLFLGPGAVELGWKRPKGRRAGASLALSQAFQSRERAKREATNQLSPPSACSDACLLAFFKKTHPLSPLQILECKHLHSDQALPAHAAKAVKAVDKVAGMSTAQLVSFFVFSFLLSFVSVGMRANAKERGKRDPGKGLFRVSFASPLAVSFFFITPPRSEGR